MATVHVWDKNFDHVASVEQGWRSDEPDVIAVPLDHPFAEWLLAQTDPQAHLTVDLEGARTNGRLEEFTATRNRRNSGVLKATFSKVEEMSTMDWNREILAAGDLTAMIPNRIALAENLVAEAEARVVRAENELLAAQVGCDAAHQRLRCAREAAQAFIEGAVA